jgi:hypothetical protein
MNDGGAIGGEVCDGATLHHFNENGGEAGLDDVTAEHAQDAAAVPGSVDYRIDNREEVAGLENAWQGVEKRREARIFAWRPSEGVSRNLVGPSTYRDGANSGRINLRHFAR